MLSITTSYLQKIRSITIFLLLLPCLVSAHNNPEFTNIPLTSIEVDLPKDSDCENTRGSSKFSISPPKETVRIVWNVASENKEKISFSVKQGNEIIAKDIQHGAEMDPNLINGDKLIITNVKGAEAPFKLEVLARLIVEKKKNKSVTTSAGKKVYKKANCVGCHKWHGDGGGGYGGAALSLRTTPLDAKFMKEVIRCGRPSTGMPYHGKKAYKGDDNSCYETTSTELGEDMPPRARSLLSERELNAVVDYVVSVIKGSGEPNFEQCAAYWGEKSRQCDSFKK